MAISVIQGLMGSGKSHQAVKYIMVPAFMSGRRILTNIKGINEEELIKYCEEEHSRKYRLLEKSGKEVPELNLGKVVIINDINIRHPDFFPTLEDVDNKEVIHDEKSFVKSGDLLLIDEAGQFYDQLTKPDLVFFTMHRHFTDSQGVSSDVCLLVQDRTLLHRNLLKLVQTTYHCKKLLALGFSSKYSLSIYDGNKVNFGSRISQSVASYDKRIFPIYSSYAAGSGKEKRIDNRFSVFKNTKTWLFFAFIVIAPFFIYKGLTGFFNQKPKNFSSASASSSSPSSASSPAQSQAVPVPPPEPTYKIVGVIDLPSRRLVFLQDSNSNLKVTYPTYCQGSGILMTCQIENKLVSYYSPISKHSDKFLGGYNDNKNNTNTNNNNNNGGNK